jgi:hypothetical protein
MGVLFIIVCGALGLWLVINPESFWEVSTSWQYRDPEANEPSEAAFWGQRFTGVLLLVGVTGLGVSMVQSGQVEKRSLDCHNVLLPEFKRVWLDSYGVVNRAGLDDLARKHGLTATVEINYPDSAHPSLSVALMDGQKPVVSAMVPQKDDIVLGYLLDPECDAP